MRIDQGDIAGEDPIGIAAKPDAGLLSDLDQGKIALSDIGQHPDQLVIRNPEQNIAGSGSHAVDRYPLHDLAVLRRRPARVSWDFARALDVGNKLLRGIQIFKASARAFQGLIANAGAGAGIERRKIFGGGARQVRAIDAHQPLALMDMRTGRDVFDAVDKTFEPQRYD